MSALIELEKRLQDSLGKTVIGMRDLIRALTIAAVARGHVLVQGAPGLGKTLLGKSLAAAFGGRLVKPNPIGPDNRIADCTDPCGIERSAAFLQSTDLFFKRQGWNVDELILSSSLQRAIETPIRKSAEPPSGWVRRSRTESRHLKRI